MADDWSAIGTPVVQQPKKSQPTTGWDTVGTPVAYQSNDDFRAAMDKNFGPGKWRDTGDYRTDAREAQLRAQGAATARGKSAHSVGTPDAPGAHDIQVPGQDPRRVARTLAAQGYEPLAEGAAGGQGAHIHVGVKPTAQQSTSWDSIGTVVQAPPSAGPPQGSSASAPKKEVMTPASEPGLWGEVGKVVREGLTALSGGDHTNIHGVTKDNPAQAFVRKGAEKVSDYLPHKQGETRQEAGQRLIDIVNTAMGAARIPEGAAGKPLEPISLSPRLPKATVPEPAKGPSADIVGNESKPSTRTANALYRLGGSRLADTIEMHQFKQQLPADLKTPEVREKLYHALEEPMINKDAQIPDDLKPAYEALQPYLKEQTEGINALREMNDPDVDKYLEDSGYVHRIREGEPNLIEPIGGEPRSPFQTRKSLTTRPDSLKGRKFIVLEDAKGNRTFEQPNPTTAEWKPGMTVRHPVTNEVVTVKPATTKEIEANTKTRFQKDALDNTLTNVMQIRRAIRNKQVLNQTLADMQARGVAHRNEWYYRDEGGNLQIARARTQAPKGYQSMHDNPYTKGWTFDTNDAQVQELKDWLPKHEEGWLHGLDKLNNFLLRSNFLSPFVHPKNIAEFWGASRGGEWLNPGAYGRLARTSSEATREVLTMGPKYKQLLREGSALLSADPRTQAFQESLVHKAGGELINDPKSFAALRKAFGPIVGTPAELYTRFQEASHKMMWTLGDIMMMQRVLEYQEKGMPVRDAIRKAEEIIPNYRVPAQILDNPTTGRALSRAFAGNRLFSIGRYHYDRLAAWGRMYNKVAKGDAEERKEGLGQFLATAIIAYAILPIFSKALKIATGNQNARVKQGGITAIPDAAEGLYSGRDTAAQALAQVLDISPMANLAKDEITQKDYFGQDLYSKYAPPALNAAREIEEPLDQFGPFRMGMDALRQSYGPGRVAGTLAGVDLPQRPPGQAPGNVQKMLRGKERGKFRKDPLAKELQSLGAFK